jgi:hypothetical protein
MSKLVSRWYNLEGDTPVPVIAEAVDWKGRWQIKTEVNDCIVSTVFIFLDHSFGDRPPILFETLVFGGLLNDEGERYSTKAEAEAGHAKWVQRVMEAKDE